MTTRLAFAPLEAHRPRLTGSAALASLRERPTEGAPGEPLPWWRGGLAGTGAALPIPYDGSLGQDISGCGSPDCSGHCMEPASEPTPPAGGNGNQRAVCVQCGGPLGPGEMTCRTPGCRAPAGLAGLTRAGVEIH